MYLKNLFRVLRGCETIRTFLASSQKGNRMKLTTDVAIRKWKPKSEGERASCGQSLYVQGYSNGKRSCSVPLTPKKFTSLLNT